mmetsp:Transcript_62400/g.141095  ORF Transcript_62400/g.141095 Transcript_62400/m.141095 type:complete len:293 (-) Transcript_62400:3106-3984(-)
MLLQKTTIINFLGVAAVAASGTVTELSAGSLRDNQKIHRGASATRTLAYDVGFFNGDDTALLLSQGYRVIALEANPILWAKGQKRFSSEIQHHRLVLLHAGLPTLGNEGRPTLNFYVNTVNEEWSSFVWGVGCRGPAWAKDHNRASSSDFCRAVPINTTSCTTVLGKYGIPLIMKLDVEGAEWGCVSAIKQFKYRPSYVVIENNPFYDFELMSELGYDSFKYVNQGFTKISDWGVSSGPMGEYGIDCQMKWRWRNLTSIKEIRNPPRSPECLGWADIHARHNSATLRFASGI